MKLVIQRPPDKAIVRKVDEYQLKDTINGIKANYYGYEQEPLDYELFRYKLDKGVAIIYKDNKVLRTKNSWYEIRGLTNLSRHFGGQYLHSVTREFKNGMQTEIDGLDVNTKEIMVELKNQVIDQKWIEFYEKKRERLGLSQCFIVSPRFEGNISYSSKIRCFQFNPDYETLMNYYNERFILPDWFRGLLRWRHVRILLDNGRWSGIKRKLTKTAKHTPSSKIVLWLNWIVNRYRKYPMKIYYTLSPMVLPVKEYHGKGYPFSRALAALDIDSEHSDHVIGSEGYCLKCLKEARMKSELLSVRLDEQGWHYKKLYSGSKGYHFYLFQEEENKEKIKHFSECEFMEFVKSLRDDKGNYLTDNVNFTAEDGSLDLHRIFSLPHSVDMTTGILVKEDFQRLNFKDTFFEIE